MADPCARVSSDLVGAGTIVNTNGISSVLVGGQIPATLGDEVTSHGSGSHSAAVMIEASTTVFAQGVGICRQGDAASCGHTVATGDNTVLIG